MNRRATLLALAALAAHGMTRAQTTRAPMRRVAFLSNRRATELVVDRKAAAELGITLPGAFLQRADRVVDTVERPAR
jgi:hypothetical protein